MLSSFFYFIAVSQLAMALTHSTPAIDKMFESNAFILTEAQEGGGPAPAYCNASVVDATTLITAAHCVTHAIALRSQKIKVQLGYYKYIINRHGENVRIGYVKNLEQEMTARFYVLPTLASTIARTGVRTQVPPGLDIAVISLNTPLNVSADFEFAQMLPQVHLQSVLNSANQYSPTVVTTNYWEESSTDSRRYASLNHLTYKSSGYFESKSNSRVQAQDSGGGLFINLSNKRFLIGVVKGEASSILIGSWDVYNVAAGKVCDIAKHYKMPAPQIQILCL